MKSKKREKEINKSGSAKKVCHRYIYAEKLLFLEKCIQLRETEESAEPSITNVVDEPTDENTSPSSSATSSAKRRTAYGKKRNYDIDNEFSGYLKDAREVMKKRILEDSDDEDMAFFKSILSTVKKLNPQKKMQFRIHTMSYLQSLSTKEDESATLQPFQQSAMHRTYMQSPSLHHTHFQPSEVFYQKGQVNPQYHQRLYHVPSNLRSPQIPVPPHLSYTQQPSFTESASSSSSATSSTITSPDILQHSENDFS